MTAVEIDPESGSAGTTGEASLPLDAIHDLARNGGVREALDALNASLAIVRRSASPEAWLRAVARSRAHPLRDFIHRDPFTFRCFAKPRGYPGDATAVDYVLRRRDLAIRAADPVAELHHYTTHGALARALLHRRDLTANVADEIASRASDGIRIFSAGCGHARELDRLRAIDTGRVRKIVAFDADPQNLETLHRDYPRLPIAVHQGSVRQLIEGRHLFGDMDFIHSGSLLDALPQASAGELVRALFAALHPSGTLLITALLEGFPEAGYLEAYMDWRILYRSRAALEGLATTLPDDAVESVTYLQNPEGTLGSLAIQRR
jgi:extracellular factor (EF) 3-hydroxypalmitic acid methyl ester biosynthesis protein